MYKCQLVTINVSCTYVLLVLISLNSLFGANNSEILTKVNTIPVSIYKFKNFFSIREFNEKFNENSYNGSKD